MKLKCIICHKKLATVPDRNNFPSRRKKLCSDCHSKRLANDIVNVIAIKKRKGNEVEKD